MTEYRNQLQHPIQPGEIHKDTDLDSCYNQDINRRIKHGFPISIIRKVPRDKLKTKGEAPSFSSLLSGTPECI